MSFIYTGCFQVRPTSTRALLEALQAVRSGIDLDQFHVVSIGFNQPADSPQAMKACAAAGHFICELGLPEPTRCNRGRFDARLRICSQTTLVRRKPDPLLQISIVDAEGFTAQVYGDDFRADRTGEPLRQLLSNQPLPSKPSLSDLADLCTGVVFGL